MAPSAARGIGRRFVAAAAVCACALVRSPVRVLAQSGVTPELTAHETLWVTTTDGRTEKGHFRSWSGSDLLWETADGFVRTSLEDVDRIEAPDPIRDGTIRGTLIGAAVGAAFGAFVGLGPPCETNCGADYSRTKDVLSGMMTLGLVGAGVGATLGAVLDKAIHPRRLVYERTSTVTLMPMIEVGRLGAAASVRW